jgi:hypothetical protein
MLIWFCPSAEKPKKKKEEVIKLFSSSFTFLSMEQLLQWSLSEGKGSVQLTSFIGTTHSRSPHKGEGSIQLISLNGTTYPGKPFWRERLSTVDLLQWNNLTREALLKGKAGYIWPPSMQQLIKGSISEGEGSVQLTSFNGETPSGKPFWRERLSTVDLLQWKNSSREPLLKAKAQYSWPPSLEQLIQGALIKVKVRYSWSP